MYRTGTNLLDGGTQASKYCTEEEGSEGDRRIHVIPQVNDIFRHVFARCNDRFALQERRITVPCRMMGL